MQVTYHELAKLITEIPEAKNTVYLAGHIPGDMDSICSTLALTKFLNQVGFDAKMLLPESEMTLLDWYDDKDDQYATKQELIVHEADEHIDIFFIMDTNLKSRLGEFAKYCEAADLVINIDHHENNQFVDDYVLVEEEISATCEMVAELIWSFPENFVRNDGMTKEIATLLFAGIVSDTYSFKDRTDAGTFKVVAELCEYDIDTNYIIRSVYFDKSPEEMAALGILLANLRYKDFHYVVIDEQAEWFQAIGYNSLQKVLTPIICSNTDIDIFSFLIVKEDGRITGEFRSNCELDVDELAASMGKGGGHKKASGFINDMDLDENIEIIKSFVNTGGIVRKRTIEATETTN